MKWIGALLVFVSCAALGFIKAFCYRTEERYLSDWIRILDHIHCELEYRLSPLPQICQSASEMTFGCLKVLLQRLSSSLNAQVSADAGQCLRMAIAQADEIPISLQKQLMVLSESIGCYDLDGQLLQIAAARKECADALQQIRTQGKERIRNCQTLGICAGAGLAILLL